MRRDEFGDLALATALLAVAGFVDAVGFLTLGHLFVSFASGNSTQFAIAIGGTALTKAAPAAGALVGTFVSGVVAGRMLAIAANTSRRPAILLVEAVLLTAAAVLPLGGAQAAYLMALAMGAQNAVVQKAGETQTALTYVTGTLVHMGQKLADALCRAGPPGAWLPYLALWAAMMVGAALGGIGYSAFRLHALLVPAASILALAALTGRRAWRARRRR